jgi:hypothetical protein
MMVTIDPRLLARFGTTAGAIAAGRYTIHAGANAGNLSILAEFDLTAFRLKP